jgi:hypothetical protein
MIRVVDTLDDHRQASGLGRFHTAAAETGVVNGTILDSVKFHGNTLVCFCGCCELLCRWVFCSVLLRSRN